MRRPWLLAAVLTACSLSASAEVTLLAPRNGERLEGGREATLMWSAGALPGHVEEWEAFLSVDGGKYYAVRVTPHLDARVRTVRWRVPNIAATNARLMLRVGDEEREQVIELPQTFTIVPRTPLAELPAIESDAGERALPDGEPTVEWVSSDFVTHRRADAMTSRDAQLVSAVPFDFEVVTAQPPDLTPPRLAARSSAPQKENSTSIAATPRQDVLLLSTRMNV